MPSYPLSDNTKYALRGEASRLLDLHINAAEYGFPLTRAQVIECMIPADILGYVNALIDADAYMPRANHIYAIFEACPEVGSNRGVMLQIFVENSVPYVWEDLNEYRPASSFFDSRPSIKAGTNEKSKVRLQRLTFDWYKLDDDTRAKLGKWIYQAQLQRRRASAAKDLIHIFINAYCKNTGELLCRWPGLRTLFKFPHDRSMKHWRDRVLDPPVRQMSRWGWWGGDAAARTWYADNHRKIEAADALLQSAAMLDKPIEKKDAPVRAKVMKYDTAPLGETVTS